MVGICRDKIPPCSLLTYFHHGGILLAGDDDDVDNNEDGDGVDNDEDNDGVDNDEDGDGVHNDEDGDNDDEVDLRGVFAAAGGRHSGAAQGCHHLHHNSLTF